VYKQDNIGQIHAGGGFTVYLYLLQEASESCVWVRYM